ncbi:DUF1127 domain-containing protein [Arenibacterium sp. CAU 1754]
MTQSMTAQTLNFLSTSPRLPLAATIAVRIAGVVATWDQLSRTRRDLAQLSDHMLDDIGLTYAQARRESKRWFWQV